MDLTVYFNGELLRDSEVPLSIYDHGLLFGDGIRIDIRVYKKRPFHLQYHLKTLFDSAKELGINIKLTEKTIEKTIRILLDLNSFQDALASIVVTRGEGQLCLDANLSLYPSVLIMTLPPVEVPENLRYEGVHLSMSNKRGTPDYIFKRQIFTLSRQKEIQALYEAHQKGAFESLIINLEGQVCEGAFSSLFLVKEGNLVTPDLSCGVRPYVMRQVVMQMAKRMGYSVVEALLQLGDLFHADECFLTSTEWEILPVIKVDQHPIGNGRPGKVTNHLMSGLKTLIYSGTDLEPTQTMSNRESAL